MANQELNCCQINLQHSRTATSNLVQLINQHRIDVAFVQEPYTIRNQLAGIPKTFRTYTYGNDRSRAAVIISNKDIDATTITQISDKDCIAIEIKYNGKTFYGASMYFDSNEDIKGDLQKMENMLHYTNGNSILILADTNARSKLWYDVINNERGKMLEEFITVNNLHIINENIGVPTFETRRGRSWIDLTLSNSQLLGNLTAWNIGDEESCSDHKLISFKIARGMQNQPYTFKTTRYITCKEDYERFDCLLTTNISSTFKVESNSMELDKELSKTLTAHMETEQLINLFYTCISEACNKAFRPIKGKGQQLRGKSVPWWTPELTILRKKVNALRRRYQRTINNDQLRQERKDQYMEGLRQYRSKINMQKIESWKEFCNITDGSNPWNTVYKLAAGKLRNQNSLSTLQKEDGTYTTNLESTVKYMLQQFFPDDRKENDNEEQQQLRKKMLEPPETSDDMEFTQEEIRGVLKGFSPKKSPGEDGLTSEIIKRVFRLLPCSFTNLYNKCLKNGCFPKIWKNSVIIPIVKPGKERSSDVSKYRPISLLNIGGKVLEKLMINRILHHIHSRNLFSSRQFGFMPQKSTIDAAMTLKLFVEQNLQIYGYVAIISLDVQNAFNAAWWPSILNNLKELECPRNLYQLSLAYFHDRTASLSTNSYKITTEVNMGCPQGSCCGPGYWNILYNNLLNTEFSHRTEVIAFADDLLILTKGRSIKEAENFANLDIKQIEFWARKNKIKFNDTKSKVLLVTRKKNIENQEINIYLNNKTIEQVNEMKYLGIYLDRKFSFDKHIAHIHDKAIGLLHALSKSAKLTWGLGNKALHTIYKGAIEPILTYGSPVWQEAIGKRKNLKKLQRIQRLVNIKIAKAHKTISYDASCVVAGIQPIDITVHGKAKIYKSTHGGCDYDQQLEPSEWLHPAERVLIKETQENTDYNIKIFTDGSKTGEKVGAAAVIFQGDNLIQEIKYKLRGQCSNNQAEQAAILKALQELKENKALSSGRKVAALYTDSRITLSLLENNRSHYRLIEDILKLVRFLQQNEWQIHFGWVKAHAGIDGNERADKLAKEAAENENLEIIYNKTPKTTIIESIKHKEQEEWQIRWNNTSKGLLSKTFFPSIKERLKIKLPLTPDFTAIVTGHGKTKAYLHRFHIIDNPTCTCKKAQQTVNHLIYECPDIGQQRLKLINQIIQNGDQWPVTNQQLIFRHLRNFCEFVKSMNL